MHSCTMTCTYWVKALNSRVTIWSLTKTTTAFLLVQDGVGVGWGWRWEWGSHSLETCAETCSRHQRNGLHLATMFDVKDTRETQR